ncbi:MAG TPA: MFS transporter [Vicinamibacterales bacterium]|nr:MFS transporter [Vicinamibacterales bacterium]
MVTHAGWSISTPPDRHPPATIYGVTPTMAMPEAGADASPTGQRQEMTAFAVLAAISLSHLLNDVIQSLLPAIYPLLKVSFNLSFAQIGMMTLALMLTASVLQPVVGHYTDSRPTPHALLVGMAFSLLGLLMLAAAHTYWMLLTAAGLVGLGSSVFHPESSRIARMASGGRHGLAQSLFQVGGNLGSAIGPLVAAFVVAPYGQRAIAWCAVIAIAGMIVVSRIGRWYRDRQAHPSFAAAHRVRSGTSTLSRGRVGWSLAVLGALIFSKYFYLASLTSYYTFYLITKFEVSVRSAQVHLFIFLAAVAAGTIIGGPIGDRFGRKHVIWGSILGVLPFTLALPFANLLWTTLLTIVIGLTLASAFSAIVVYAQELVPGRIGLISGVFFGFAFGMGGLGAAALGELADAIGIEAVYRICAFLPAFGLLTAFLPDVDSPAARRAATARVASRA